MIIIVNILFILFMLYTFQVYMAYSWLREFGYRTRKEAIIESVMQPVYYVRGVIKGYIGKK